GALAVQLLRDQLDLALGSAVRSSADAGLLIRWLSADMGSTDSGAVEALGRLVGRRDARYLSFRAGMEAAERGLGIPRAAGTGWAPRRGLQRTVRSP
ncbi:MAG: hypothetical protein JWM47_4317, partial [Acidimicrobiales bacterium]|nr:hypothetical protein [Acidimicrobiales bacterium]